MTPIWILWAVIVSTVALLLHPIILLALIGWLLKSAQMHLPSGQRVVEGPASSRSSRRLHPAVKFGIAIVAAVMLLIQPMFGLPVLIFLLVQTLRSRKERSALSETENRR